MAWAESGAATGAMSPVRHMYCSDEPGSAAVVVLNT
jgi:hypothetical protein